MSDYLPVPVEPDPVPGPRKLGGGAPEPLARRLGRLVGTVPDLLRLSYRLLRDPRVPVRRRMVAAAALGYVVLPVDIIPDAIPGLGQVDDLVVVSVALRLLMDGAGPDVVAEHWDGPQETLDVVDTVITWGAELVPSRLRRSLRRLTR